MNKERKKYIMMIMEASGFLNYGATIPKEACEQMLQEVAGTDEYIFGMMTLRDLLNGRGWLCKIRNQEYIEILESKNINLEQNRWSQNHQKKYRKRDEALSNIHYDQVDKDDVDKIMLERAKLSAVLRGIKSVLNKYL
jgi:hypothetical protein